MKSRGSGDVGDGNVFGLRTLELPESCDAKPSHARLGIDAPRSLPTRLASNNPTINHGYTINSIGTCRANWNNASNVPWPLNHPRAPVFLSDELPRSDNSEVEPRALLLCPLR